MRERRPTATNKDELLELMSLTRNVRRAWIARNQPTITDIIKRYPRLTDLPNAVSILRLAMAYYIKEGKMEAKCLKFGASGDFSTVGGIFNFVSNLIS